MEEASVVRIYKKGEAVHKGTYDIVPFHNPIVSKVFERCVLNSFKDYVRLSSLVNMGS